VHQSLGGLGPRSGIDQSFSPGLSALACGARLTVGGSDLACFTHKQAKVLLRDAAKSGWSAFSRFRFGRTFGDRCPWIFFAVHYSTIRCVELMEPAEGAFLGPNPAKAVVPDKNEMFLSVAGADTSFESLSNTSRKPTDTKSARTFAADTLLRPRRQPVDGQFPRHSGPSLKQAQRGIPQSGEN
jgi:hypothetical protein